jgi:mevalonate kinase
LLNNTRDYPAKLLLFGEYTVTLGSPALAVPVRSCSAHWALDDSNVTSAMGLRHLYQYLLAHREAFDFIDLEQFNHDLESGWTLTSDIPAGYGLGSSGSAIAAVYDVYSKNKTEDLSVLKTVMASMENAFHGQSSGIDPVVSYLNSPVLMEGFSGIKKCQPDISSYQFFLIDSGVARSTLPFVQIFQEKMNRDPDFRIVTDELWKHNEMAIQTCLSGDRETLFRVFQKISALQQEFFSEMILSEWNSVWSKGLSSGDYFLKLCGAGGGGLILGMCREGLDIHKRLPQCKFIQI